jgi:UDP-glucose 4-epimerase
MNILVTGGTGFLGSRLVKYLKSHDVEVFRGDVLDIRAVKEALRFRDTVVHLVGLNDATCRENPVKAYDVNVLGTYNLLRNEDVYWPLQRVIYFSTIHVYGFPPAGVITEESRVNPKSVYAISHYLAEEMVLRHPGGLVLRLSNGFGCPAGQGPTGWVVVVNKMCRDAVETGEIILNVGDSESRNFVTVGDICRTVGHFLEKPRPGVYNVGSSQTLSILTMAFKVGLRCEALFGFRPRVVYDDRNVLPNTSDTLDYRIDKLKATGFEPLEDFDNEIDATLRLIHGHFTTYSRRTEKIKEAVIGEKGSCKKTAS